MKIRNMVTGTESLPYFEGTMVCICLKNFIVKVGRYIDWIESMCIEFGAGNNRAYTKAHLFL